MENINKIDFNKPVDAYDAEGNLREAGSISEENSTEVSQTEENKEGKDTHEKEEQKVPYSRFSKVRQEREEALQEAEDAKRLLRELSESRSQRDSYRESPTSSYEEEYARQVKKLYGDTPQADEIIRMQLARERSLEERAERRALEAVDRRAQFEQHVFTVNESTLDSRLQNFYDSLGRELTEKEINDLLTVVDEYTPTGENGKYTGELVSFDKAWEILELRQGSKSQSSRNRRSAAVAASGSRSEGNPFSSPENDKNFNPTNWKSYHDRLNKLGN